MKINANAMNFRCNKKMEYINIDPASVNDFDLEILFVINYDNINYSAYEKCQSCYLQNSKIS